MPAQVLKSVIFLLGFSFTIICKSFGQDTSGSKPSSDLFIIDKAKISKLKLVDLRSKPKQKSWRLLLEGSEVASYVIEIHLTKSGIYSGFVSPYTEEQVNESEEKPTNRSFYYRSALTDTVAHKIYNLMKEMHIDQIPDQAEIKGWRPGLDGDIFYIENYDGLNYTSKSYWSPDAVNLPEAKTIDSFIKKVKMLVDMTGQIDAFYKRVPYGKFGVGKVKIKRLTLAQWNAYKKERDQYRKKHHLD